MGELEEAVGVCRAGLMHHPGYLSAHVTLGRALMALGHDEEARAEFEQVLRAAPDNLVALRCLEELRPSTGSAGSAASTASAIDGSTEAPVASSDVERSEQQSAEQQSAEMPGGEPSVPALDPALEELEGLLAAIRSNRAVRGSDGT